MNLEKYLCWEETPIVEENGVIIGADIQQEWMLKWWWENYQKHNLFPVVFIDFGMSKAARLWCKNKGKVLNPPVPESLFASKESLNPKDIAFWESLYHGDPWKGRLFWLQKPFCLLKTPFKYTAWIDLDCEIHSPIDKLFSSCQKKDGISLVEEPEICLTPWKENGDLPKDGKGYNAGVIGFKRHSPVISEWARNVLRDNPKFFTDQMILNRTIYQENFQINHLPQQYNWKPSDGVCENAVITHHVADHGKWTILKKIKRSFS